MVIVPLGRSGWAALCWALTVSVATYPVCGLVLNALCVATHLMYVTPIAMRPLVTCICGAVHVYV